MERHLTLELLDTDKLVKVNNLKEITSPIPFSKYGQPSDDGVLSNTIFGIDKTQRSETYAYINLYDWFLHPAVYKIWGKMDSNIKAIVHGTKRFIIDSNGLLVEDENGKTGLKFLKDNIDNINIRSTGSRKRDTNIKFIEMNKKNLFIRKLIVQPAYYRDVDTSKGYVGVGEENKYYNQLLISVRSLKETEDYGLPTSDAIKGRIQELILEIYKWFTTGVDGNAGAAINGKDGRIRKAVMTHTTDYSTRLVLSAPNLRAEVVDDLEVDIDHTAVPLASLVVNLYPFVLFWLRRFFENEFSNRDLYNYIDTKGNQQTVHLKNTLVEFSDGRLEHEINRFLHGYSNRFIPIEVPNEEGKKIYMRFVGQISTSLQNTKPEDSNLVQLNRYLTWCDLLYMACVEMSKDKCVIVTRFPMDNYTNQFSTKIVVSSTKETEPIFYNTQFYPRYPKIRQEDIGKDTSSTFKDTLNMSNTMLASIGGDYDGDTVSIKIPYSTEANIELNKYVNSKKRMINLRGGSYYECSKEAIQSIYSLTKVLPSTKLINPVF